MRLTYDIATNAEGQSQVQSMADSSPNGAVGLRTAMQTSACPSAPTATIDPADLHRADAGSSRETEHRWSRPARGLRSSMQGHGVLRMRRLTSARADTEPTGRHLSAFSDASRSSRPPSGPPSQRCASPPADPSVSGNRAHGDSLLRLEFCNFNPMLRFPGCNVSTLRGSRRTGRPDRLWVVLVRCQR
ncbi:hypothetical protein VTN00DRAFT_5932 [Thermoascus crustaceus]|uniref:uncharacterized protein n=1 Tax=Thermoascus crustaceus TaxID=5088 RepID=UPI0037442878